MEQSPGSRTRSRWAAIGAAVAVTLGAGGLLGASAANTQSAFVPITPCRLLDTRPGSDNVGPRATPLGAGEVLSVTAVGTVGKCTLPAGISGLSMNVTAINPTADGYLTVYPGTDRPLSGNLTWVAGQAPTGNAVTSSVSGAGVVSFYNYKGTVNLAVDVLGYYTASNAGTPGPKGDTGATGATGATGSTGATGQRGVSAWETIPSGTTITGNWGTQAWYVSNLVEVSVPFPAIGPGLVDDTKVNFAPDVNVITSDDDAACTGTYTNPTAPAGKVCLYPYVITAPGDLRVSGSNNNVLQDRGFYISWTQPTSGSVAIFLTWAYTAP